MKKLLVCAAIATLGLQVGCASSSGDRPEKQLSKHERAILSLDLAAANIAENDGTGALLALRESEQLENDIPETYYLYALAYHLKNEPALAIQSARKAIDMKPNFSKAKNTLGKLLLDQGKYDDAEKFLKEAAQDLLFNEAFLAKANLGVLYYKKMNFPKAETYLTQAIQEGRDRTCVAAYYRGKIYMEQNLLDKALSDFNRASHNSCSRITEAHLAKGQTLIRMKRYDLARAKMLEIKQLFPMSEAADKAQQYLREIP